VIKSFTFNSKDPKFFKEGMHAKNYSFKSKDGKEQTIYDYFLRKYNVDLQFWFLPLIETEKAGYFPMEVCVLSPNQKYQFKLDPTQV